MNQVLLLSTVLFIFLTYKFLKVFKTKEVPKGNKIIAWSLYGFSIIGIITLNILFS